MSGNTLSWKPLLYFETIRQPGTKPCTKIQGKPNDYRKLYTIKVVENKVSEMIREVSRVDFK